MNVEHYPRAFVRTNCNWQVINNLKIQKGGKPCGKPPIFNLLDGLCEKS